MIAQIKNPDQGSVSTLKNQKIALDTIFLDSENQPFDLYVYTPPIYPYVWDHMLTWYAEKKYETQPKEYGYQRSDEARDDYYLLIEPDELPSRIDGWKGNFSGKGEFVRSWQLPGGITLEKWKAVNNGSNE